MSSTSNMSGLLAWTQGLVPRNRTDTGVTHLPPTTVCTTQQNRDDAYRAKPGQLSFDGIMNAMFIHSKSKAVCAL